MQIMSTNYIVLSSVESPNIHIFINYYYLFSYQFHSA